jgi:hypothetical protein
MNYLGNINTAVYNIYNRVPSSYCSSYIYFNFNKFRREGREKERSERRSEIEVRSPSMTNTPIYRLDKGRMGKISSFSHYNKQYQFKPSESSKVITTFLTFTWNFTLVIDVKEITKVSVYGTLVK